MDKQKTLIATGLTIAALVAVYSFTGLGVLENPVSGDEEDQQEVEDSVEDIYDNSGASIQLVEIQENGYEISVANQGFEDVNIDQLRIEADEEDITEDSYYEHNRIPPGGQVPIMVEMETGQDVRFEIRYDDQIITTYECSHTEDAATC